MHFQLKKGVKKSLKNVNIPYLASLIHLKGMAFRIFFSQHLNAWTRWFCRGTRERSNPGWHQKKYSVSTATYQVWFPGVHLILQMDPQSSPISGVLEVSASTQRSHSLRNWNQSQSQKISMHTKEILNMYIIHGLR